MRRLLLALVCLASCGKQSPPPPAQLDTILADDIKKHQTVLAADDMEGRGAGTEGGKKASGYIADQVKVWGFKPAGTDGSFFQPFGENRRNVVAFWPGTGGDEYVVIGAHYDHVGKKGDAVFPGADDNASGASTVLDVAEAVAKSSFRRGVVCIWFDEEEDNLKGSRWWATHPTFPIDKCFAMLNCDMIGRNETTKIYVGVEKKAGEPKYPKWAAEIREAESKFKATFDWTEFDAFIQRSDHWPFMQKGVPALFFTGGLHPDYHKEGDRLEKINFPKEELIGRILYTLLARAATREEPLK